MRIRGRVPGEMNSAPPAGEFRQLVVIGASLGGLNALKTVLSALPPDFPCPIVVVQHREKTTEDLLTGLLETVCALPVAETEDKEPVAWGRVYLAPVNYHLLVEDPSTAEAPRMPEAALAAVTADAVLPLEAIGPFLAKLSMKKRRSRHARR